MTPRPILTAAGHRVQRACPHDDKTHVVQPTSNGYAQIRLACAACGKKFGDALPHRSHPSQATYPEWRPHPNPCDCCGHRSDVIHRRWDPSEYDEYLRSEQWQERRAYAVRRALERCQVCNRGDLPLNVHHRTYHRLGAEFDADLTVLCRSCHKLYHTQRHAPLREAA